MKKNLKSLAIFSLLILIFGFSAVTVANAEEGSSTTDRWPKPENIRDRMEGTREERQEKFEATRQEMQDKLESRKAEMEGKMEERKAKIEERRVKLSERRKEVVKNIVERIFRLFDNLTNKLSANAERIQTRINQFEEKGVDVSETQQLLDDANSALDDAIVEIEAAKELVNSSVEEEVSKESIRELIGTAKTAIKDARDKYVLAIRSLKASIGNRMEDHDKNKNATSTDDQGGGDEDENATSTDDQGGGDDNES